VDDHLRQASVLIVKVRAGQRSSFQDRGNPSRVINENRPRSSFPVRVKKNIAVLSPVPRAGPFSNSYFHVTRTVCNDWAVILSRPLRTAESIASKTFESFHISSIDIQILLLINSCSLNRSRLLFSEQELISSKSCMHMKFMWIGSKVLDANASAVCTSLHCQVEIDMER